MKKIFTVLCDLVRITLRWGAYLLTILMTTLYLLGALSPHIRPSLSAVPAMLGLIFPLLFVGQVLAFLYWLLRGKWRIVLMLVLVWVASWGAISAYFPINRPYDAEATGGSARTIKVISYNTNAFGFRRHSVAKPNPILRYLKSMDADIVCLQESMTGSTAEYGVTSQQMRSYLAKTYPHIHESYAQEGGSKLILLSKYPIKHAERVPIESRANGAVWYRLQVDDTEIMVMNVHLESFRLRKKDGDNYVQMVRERNAFGLKEVFESRFTPIFVRHEEQAEQIARIIADYGARRTIVCGDYNDTPISYARCRIARGMQDSYIECGNGLGLSYTTGLFRVRIDHILCGTLFEPISSQVDAFIRASDHYPIVSTLRLRTSEDATSD